MVVKNNFNTCAYRVFFWCGGWYSLFYFQFCNFIQLCCFLKYFILSLVLIFKWKKNEEASTVFKKNPA